MAKFVLIDHSLGGIGGHHYDYAVHVLRAAEALGFKPVLAANRRFRRGHDLPPQCRCYSLFRYHTYSKYTIFAGGQRRLIDPQGESPSEDVRHGKLAHLVQRAWHWIDDQRHRHGPKRRIDDIIAGCGRLFRETPLESGDQVFVPTLSELDLLALSEYWKTDSRTRLADWHLQFHFNIFDGREPDYVAQFHRLEELKLHLERTLRGVPHHRLHFYNTTEQLSAQYNLTGVADFQPLPYPVNSDLFSHGVGRAEDGPLRITCAGGGRAEKGLDELSGIVRGLWDDLLSEGRVQILVQSKSCRLSSRPRFMLPVPPDAETDRCVARPDVTHRQAIVYVKHPLEIEDYASLIRRADIGLFLYDSDRYYVRRAGIMGEYLSAGVPVVVPAGCWLSEQIAESIHQHQQRLADQLQTIARLRGSDVSWRRAEGDCQGERLSFGSDSDPATGEMDVPPGASELLVSFRRVEPSGGGTYVRLAAELLDDHDQVVGRDWHIVGRRQSGAAVTALLRLAEQVRRLRLRWSNAYHESTVAVADVAFDFLSSAVLPGASCPLGSVGLIAGDVSQVPDLIRDMERHYEHYRCSAEAFARQWNKQHDPRRTIETLLSRAADRVAAPRAA
ncbi:MAG: hypothetical protein RIC55_35535 [Pirellulaceae bacterium]